MIIKTRFLPPGASAFTVWPFIFVHPWLADDEGLLRHENTHLNQQKRWALYGLGVGLLVWFILYLLVLPVGWNPWRLRWETEAMVEEGLEPEAITERLKHKPYYLFASL